MELLDALGPFFRGSLETQPSQLLYVFASVVKNQDVTKAVIVQRSASAIGRRRGPREGLRIAIVTWVERAYHRRRRQPALGKLTPIEYELVIASTVTQAA